MFYCPTPQISRDFQPRGRFYYSSSVVTSSPTSGTLGRCPKEPSAPQAHRVAAKTAAPNA